jgi:D-glycero-D-manno-heptose 1,7-bisphosphate phosphatase
MHTAVFLDRDGVLNHNRADYVKSWDEFIFLPGVLDALADLAQTPYKVILLTNQSAIGRGLMTGSMLASIHRNILSVVSHHGGRIDGIYFCPHSPKDNCSCRKPKPGMLLTAAQDHEIDLSRSFLVGDAFTDIKAAMLAGCQPILVLTGREKEQMALIKPALLKKIQIEENLKSAILWIRSTTLDPKGSD